MNNTFWETVICSRSSVFANLIFIVTEKNKVLKGPNHTYHPALAGPVIINRTVGIQSMLVEPSNETAFHTFSSLSTWDYIRSFFSEEYFSTPASCGCLWFTSRTLFFFIPWKYLEFAVQCSEIATSALLDSPIAYTCWWGKLTVWSAKELQNVVAFSIYVMHDSQDKRNAWAFQNSSGHHLWACIGTLPL